MSRYHPSLFALFFFGLLIFCNSQADGATVTPVGVDEETNDAWRSSDIEKPFGDDDNIYGTDGYLIAQFSNGDPRNMQLPPYASIQLVPGRGFEGVGAEPYQARFDDVTQTGTGVIPNLICGDYWVNSGVTGTVNDFFRITLNRDTGFRLGVITDTTPEGVPGLLWEAARSVKVTGPGGADSGLVDATGPNAIWRDADVDYVIFDISGNAGDVFTVWGEQDARWQANALGGVFLDPPKSDTLEITQIRQDAESGALTIEFTSIDGALYGIDTSTDLMQWNELDDGVLGMGETTEYIDTIIAPVTRAKLFYRVRKL
jgi:hypothetical protein